MHKVKPCVEGMGRPEQTQRELKNSRNLASWERERVFGCINPDKHTLVFMNCSIVGFILVSAILVTILLYTHQ